MDLPTRQNKQEKHPFNPNLPGPSMASDRPIVQRNARPKAAIKLLYPAFIGNGVHDYDQGEVYLEIFKQNSNRFSCAQIILASGSGKKMLKTLDRFNTEFNPEKETFSKFCNRTKNYELVLFFQNLKHFPFYTRLKRGLDRLDTDGLSPDEKKSLIVDILLKGDRFKFLSQPKALLPFYQTKKGKGLSAFDSHLFQNSAYACYFKKMTLLFETAKTQQPLFDMALKSFYKKYPDLASGALEIGFLDVQKPENLIGLAGVTHTFDENGDFYLSKSHDGFYHRTPPIADIVHISNLDNVAKPEIQENVVELRKQLAGKLMLLQDTIFKVLPQLEQNSLSEKEITYCLAWIKIEFFVDLTKSLHKLSRKEKNKALFQFLNKPFRVCAVVADTCRSGGAPFWTETKNGTKSLRLVKENEIDLSDKNQQAIFEKALYFNPVEMCCGLKDYRGKPIGQAYFKTPETKDENDRSVMADLNRWNSMPEKWNTVFIKTDTGNFHPVESMLDLLHKTHH